MEDGTVEALVQGTPDQVDHMLEWLRRPPGAWVAEIVTRREYTDKRYIRFEQLGPRRHAGRLSPGGGWAHAARARTGNCQHGRRAGRRPDQRPRIQRPPSWLTIRPASTPAAPSHCSGISASP